jgi:omega-3 fatty acid desaturase (delta-15 desaturase)
MLAIWKNLVIEVNFVQIVFAQGVLKGIEIWALLEWSWDGCQVILISCLYVGLHSGHGSFSNNKNLNNLVGHLTHSSILVPYHGWWDPFSSVLFPIPFSPQHALW